MVWKPKVKIGYQTWIFVFSPDLWLHLRIQCLSEFVIFFDITGFQRHGSLHFISINTRLQADIVERRQVDLEKYQIFIRPLHFRDFPPNRSSFKIAA